MAPLVTLTVERTGLETLRRVGRGLSELSRLDYVPFFERTVEPDFERIQREQFASQGARGEGGSWTPLSPAYALAKARRFPGRPILEATGRLKGSLTGRGHPDSFRRLTPTSYERGTNVPYASAHARGTARMPARPPIGVTEADVTRWAEGLTDYVGRELGRVSGGLL